MLERAVERVAQPIRFLLVIALIAAIVISVVNVAGRAVFGWSLLGGDEIQVFILIAITFIGAGLVSVGDRHLRMDVVRQMLPARLKAALAVLEWGVTVGVLGFAGYHSYDYVRRLHKLGQHSPMSDVPMWIPHATVTVGFAIMVAVVALRGVAALARVRQTTDAGPRP
ncbi:TRAP transporter small permease [Amorphus sp. MBR-141]